MRARKAVSCIAVALLLLAVPVMAQPADGASSWWSWLAEGWRTVVRVLAAETAPAGEPEPAAQPVEPEDASCPPEGCVEADNEGEGRPSLDPDG